MNINATPANVVLAGKTFLIFPLTDNDNLALDSFVQGQFLHMAHASGQEDIVKLALKEAINVRWTYPPGSRILVRHGGWGRIVFQSLHLPVGTPYFDPCEGATEAELEEMRSIYTRINDIDGESSGEVKANTTA